MSAQVNYEHKLKQLENNIAMFTNMAIEFAGSSLPDDIKLESIEALKKMIVQATTEMDELRLLSVGN
jgi:hypothetical protein